MRLAAVEEKGDESVPRSRADDRGAAAVELALLLPWLMLILFGLIEFGRVMNLQITLTAAAREGVRAMALHGDPGCTAPGGTTPTGGAQRATVDAAIGSGLVCGNVVVSPTTCSPGAPVTVTATRVYPISLPFVPNAPNFPTLQVVGKGVMRCGG